MDLLGLEGRVAVVTGGGGSIGAATVKALATAGAHVLAVDIDGSRAEDVAGATKGLAGDVRAAQADVRLESDVARVVAATREAWGRLDVGVNVVGGAVGIGKGFRDLTDGEWEASMELNLYSAVRCSRAFAGAMLEQGGPGSIVNVASPAALRAAPGMVAYGAAKAALINFTWTMAVELGPAGIRANVVVPAFVAGPGMAWGGTEEEQAELARRNVPMGRVTRPEEVAGAVVAFASDLTGYSTGQMIVCDGGRLLTNPINAGLPAR